MRSFLSIVGPPCMCVALLGGIYWENGRHPRPVDAEAFHRVAKTEIEAWPRKTPDGWENQADGDIPPAAVALLKPNALFWRVYKPKDPAKVGPSKPVQLLVIQCSEPEDMSGHYPPNCYPRTGSPLEWSQTRVWNIPGLDSPIRGMEYHFAGGNFASLDSKIVYNFFVLPGRGITPEMSAVREAVGDYQHRHFGATQVQVVFSERDLDEKTRDRIFESLMAGGVRALRSVSKLP